MKNKNKDLLRADAHRYAVILAGGEGSRLKALTQAITGDGRPKQFCPILNNETLLDVTRKRIGLAVRPENTFFSLNRTQETFYKPLLKDVPAGRLVVQPSNKGTAPAILSSLQAVGGRDRNAVVGFFPSDHYFSDDRAFMRNVENAFHAAETNRDAIILLGIEPDSAETSYGWIEPEASLFGDLPGAVSRVKGFREKPDRRAARFLMQRGCLWNSFVMVGRVGTFLDMIKKNLPELARIFAEADQTAGLDPVYTRIKDTNFSGEVLEKAGGGLYVLRVANVTWSDWGEPRRVLGTLRNLGVSTEWMAYT